MGRIQKSWRRTGYGPVSTLQKIQRILCEWNFNRKFFQPENRRTNNKKVFLQMKRFLSSPSGKPAFQRHFANEMRITSLDYPQESRRRKEKSHCALKSITSWIETRFFLWSRRNDARRAHSLLILILIGPRGEFQVPNGHQRPLEIKRQDVNLKLQIHSIRYWFFEILFIHAFSAVHLKVLFCVPVRLKAKKQ